MQLMPNPTFDSESVLERLGAHGSIPVFLSLRTRCVATFCSGMPMKLDAENMCQSIYKRRM